MRALQHPGDLAVRLLPLAALLVACPFPPYSIMCKTTADCPLGYWCDTLGGDEGGMCSPPGMSGLGAGEGDGGPSWVCNGMPVQCGPSGPSGSGATDCNDVLPGQVQVTTGCLSLDVWLGDCSAGNSAMYWLLRTDLSRPCTTSISVSLGDAAEGWLSESSGCDFPANSTYDVVARGCTLSPITVTRESPRYVKLVACGNARIHWSAECE
jgi:hypothetical protein